MLSQQFALAADANISPDASDGYTLGEINHAVTQLNTRLRKMAEAHTRAATAVKSR